MISLKIDREGGEVNYYMKRHQGLYCWLGGSPLKDIIMRGEMATNHESGRKWGERTGGVTEKRPTFLTELQKECCFKKGSGGKKFNGILGGKEEEREGARIGNQRQPSRTGRRTRDPTTLKKGTRSKKGKKKAVGSHTTPKSLALQDNGIKKLDSRAPNPGGEESSPLETVTKFHRTHKSTRANVERKKRRMAGSPWDASLGQQRQKEEERETGRQIKILPKPIVAVGSATLGKKKKKKKKEKKKKRGAQTRRRRRNACGKESERRGKNKTTGGGPPGE